MMTRMWQNDKKRGLGSRRSLVLRPPTHKNRDALCKRLGRLRVKTSPEFECIRAQSFALFTDYLLEARQFIAQRFITAFPLKAGPEKIEIVLATQQFA